jgi:ABC-type antimicrobial peptide transport system permease subunit
MKLFTYFYLTLAIIFVATILFSTKIMAADTNTTVSSTVVTDKAPPTANSPSIVVNNSDVCKTAAAGAVQTQILGISSGITITDENCERIKLSRSLYSMGMKVAAVSTLCADPRVWDAMYMAGTVCPYMGSIGDEAREKWETNVDMIPDGSEVYKKVEMVKQEANKKPGLTDGQKLFKFIIAGMAMHSGIVAFFP